MKFIVDCMLGRLAKWLRILGYDTIYFSEISDRAFVNIALREKRFILTRDTLLVRRRGVKDFLLVEGDHFRDQLSFVVERLKLEPGKEILSRCILCNALLKEIDKNTVKLKVPDYVFKTQSSFMICETCNKIYWGATHKEEIEREVKTLFR
jgi:uncharacterized protein with PIN domain